MKKLLFLLFAFSLAFAMPKEQIKTHLNDDLVAAMEILKEQKSVEEKSQALFAIFDKYFDYELMAKLSLGGLYKGLNENQQQEFIKVFTKRLKFSFSEKLSLYTNQTVSIVGDETPNAKRYFVNSEIKNSSGEVFKFIFKFHQKSANDYYIYDVDILGVSVISTYRAQFEDLKSVDFNEILRRLNAKNALDDKENK